MRIKYYIGLLMVTFSFITNAQIDTSITVVAKIDFQPQYELHDGNEILLMGYTTSIGGPIDLPSPTIELKENDSVELNMWNLSQGPPHTIHLHGLDVDQQNDGVPMLSFSVAHDDTGTYIFQAPHPGTYLYHCHETSVMHVQAGMYGALIVRPQSADTLTWENGYSFHKEQTWLMSEVDTNWHHDSIINHPHDSTAMTHLILDYQPQHFLVNGKSEQQLLNTVEVVGSVGEIIYLRLANIGYYGTRMILPSVLDAQAVSSDGRPLPNVYESDTIEVLPGERYGVLLTGSAIYNGISTIEYFNLNTGEVEGTQTLVVDINGYLGTPKMDSETVKIYPNPASYELKIELPNSINGKAQLRIENMLGQVVLEQKITDAPVNVASLEDGNYIVRILSNKKEWNRKLIIRNN